MNFTIIILTTTITILIIKCTVFLGKAYAVSMYIKVKLRKALQNGLHKLVRCVFCRTDTGQGMY